MLAGEVPAEKVIIRKSTRISRRTNTIIILTGATSSLIAKGSCKGWSPCSQQFHMNHSYKNALLIVSKKAIRYQ
jgi:hypothetical protein